MERTLEQEFTLYAFNHKKNTIFEKLLSYYRDVNELNMSPVEFINLIETQLAKVIAEGRLDEVYNKIINV